MRRGRARATTLIDEFRPWQPFLRQSEADKAEYEVVRKQYDQDTQARARGEEVPERPAANYSQDLVSPRLLCAVLPDGSEEDLEEVKKDADSVYKAPTKASRAEAEAEAGLGLALEAGAVAGVDDEEHEVDDDGVQADTTREVSDDDAAAAAATVDPEADPAVAAVTSAEDAPFMDISAFVPGDYAAQTGEEYGHDLSTGEDQQEQHQEDDSTAVAAPTHQDAHGLDSYAVFHAGTTEDDAVKTESAAPRIETVAHEGVSADGNMAYSYSSTSMVYGGEEQHAEGAKIEELGDEPLEQHNNVDDDEDEDDDEEEEAGHGADVPGTGSDGV